MIERIRKQLKLQQGFTLIELLVVIAIIGVLAAIAIPKFTDATAAAGTAKIQADLSSIDTAIQIYQAQHNGSVPDDADPLPAAIIDLMQTTPTAPAKAKIAANANAGNGTYGIRNGRAIYTVGGASYYSDLTAAAAAAPANP